MGERGRPERRERAWATKTALAAAAPPDAGSAVTAETLNPLPLLPDERQRSSVAATFLWKKKPLSPFPSERVLTIETRATVPLPVGPMMRMPLLALFLTMVSLMKMSALAVRKARMPSLAKPLTTHRSTCSTPTAVTSMPLLPVPCRLMFNPRRRCRPAKCYDAGCRAGAG